ncbi:MAG: hypothetical protein ABJG15_04160 [Hyphomonadaceae bacterium]
MPTLSINTDIALLLGAALGLSFRFSNIIVGLFEAREVGAAQRLGQPTQGR